MLCRVEGEGFAPILKLILFLLDTQAPNLKRAGVDIFLALATGPAAAEKTGGGFSEDSLSTSLGWLKELRALGLKACDIMCFMLLWLHEV